MATVREIALERDPLVGPDPTWEALPAQARKQWIADIHDFPPPPMLLEMLARDLSIEYYNPRQLADQASRDPILAGRLLARANSAAFGLRKPLTSLRQAMIHLGFNLVRSTVLRHLVESSAVRLKGIVRAHMLNIQRSTDQGAVIAYNWSRVIKLAEPEEVATRCLLARLGAFLLARRFPQRIETYFAAGHEPQRLNFEANRFGVTSRSLTYKIAQDWNLPEQMQLKLFHLWTPLFADSKDAAGCVACAALALSFDPPRHMDDIQKWLSLRVHTRLRKNLESVRALRQLPSMLASEDYRREMATVAD